MLTVGDVAQQLGVSDKTVRRLVAAGDLIAYRIGGSIRVKQADLDAYLRRQLIVTDDEPGKVKAKARINVPDLLGLWS